MMVKIYNLVEKNLFTLLTSKNLKYNWNYGSLIGFMLCIQLMSGVVLSMHYDSKSSHSFFSVDYITRDVFLGWFFQSLHAVGASFFFFLMFLHMGRGLYYSSFRLVDTWLSGITLLLLSMIMAFLGYVLPWGQMSFWGATVMTGFLSVMPYVGILAVEWLWGGFSVGSFTLSRFYSLHVMLPFILVALVMLHLVFLHNTGSSNPLTIGSSWMNSAYFFPYFFWKDFYGMMVTLKFVFIVIFFFPDLFLDSAKFMPADPNLTPIHIQPEWYFLAAYAVLRGFPNKFLGLVFMVLFVVLWYLIPFFLIKEKKTAVISVSLDSVGAFWIWVANYLLLIWIGSKPVEEPYLWVSYFSMGIYFGYFAILAIFVNRYCFFSDNTYVYHAY